MVERRQGRGQVRNVRGQARTLRARPRCCGPRRLRAYEGLVEPVRGLLLPVEGGEARAPVARGRLVADEEPDEHLRVRVVLAYERDGLVKEVGEISGGKCVVVSGSTERRASEGMGDRPMSG